MECKLEEHDSAVRHLEYADYLRDFIPHRTHLSIAARDLVPTLCTVFHTHDTAVVRAEDTQVDDNRDGEKAAGLRMPWDVMGGVNAILFAMPTVTMTVAEYYDLFTDEYYIRENKITCKNAGEEYEGPEPKDYSGHCIRMVGSMQDEGIPDMIDGRLFILRTGSGITLDVSAVEGLVGCVGDKLDVYGKIQALTGIRFGPSLQHVSAINDQFLTTRTALETFQIDADGLPNAKSIGESFLSCCPALREVDLRPFHNVTSIGRSFLVITGLSSLDLSPLSKVTTISQSFLAGCRNLQSIDLSPLSRVTAICRRFLHGCTALTAIDLTPLGSLTEVGLGGWLYGCQSISGVIDLRPLRTVVLETEPSVEERLLPEKVREALERKKFLLLYGRVHDNLQGEMEVDKRVIDEKPPVRVIVPSENRLVVEAVENSMKYCKYRDKFIVEQQ